jgi:hypothetical protein
MSDPDKLRLALLGDHALRADVAKALGRHERSIARMNLPTIKIGNQNFINFPKHGKKFSTVRSGGTRDVINLNPQKLPKRSCAAMFAARRRFH